MVIEPLLFCLSNNHQHSNFVSINIYLQEARLTSIARDHIFLARIHQERWQLVATSHKLQAGL